MNRRPSVPFLVSAQNRSGGLASFTAAGCAVGDPLVVARLFPYFGWQIISWCGREDLTCEPSIEVLGPMSLPRKNSRGDRAKAYIDQACGNQELHFPAPIL